MNRADILHLGELSRVALSDEEVTSLESELPAIVSYVGAINDLVGDIPDVGQQLGARYNVMREDKVINQPDQHTDAVLREMPQTKGRYMKVKKILKAK